MQRRIAVIMKNHGEQKQKQNKKQNKKQTNKQKHKTNKQRWKKTRKIMLHF
jgi:hypothetical protein